MKFKSILAIGIILTCNKVFAQTQEQKDSIKNVSLTEIVISGNKFSEKKKNIVQKIDIISSKDLSKMNAQNTADALTQTGQVFVQKSQQGGGSPVLRGFEASRIQLSVDGIRLNNAIFRAGHLQNVISIDQNALDRIEVLSGPASTIHGSDALGGVILLKTADPKFGKTDKVTVTGANALARYSTVNAEKTGNIGIHFGNKNFASYSNLTFSQFGDLVQGKNGVDSIMNLWKKKFVVDRINGKDSMVENPDPYKQVSSGYSQVDFLQKFSIKQGKHIKHGINFQLSNSTNIPRYDRLTETSAGLPKSAEWYYGPQFRTLFAYQFDAMKMNGFFQELTANLNHQYIEESRHNRSFGKTSLNHREEKINVTGYQFALRHKDDQHELTIGSDGQFNSLKSEAHATNINTGIETKIDTRYPDGKNNMNLIGLFAQHTLKLADDKVVINDGIRFNYTSLHSTLVDTAIQFKIPILDLEQRHKALTGNLGIAFMPDEDLRLTANLSSGFRSPNFDDMTKVFESNNSRLIVPNVDLKPEYTQNAEIGVQYDNGTVALNSYGFYTKFTNAIVSGEFSYNGQDSILYNGVMTKVYASQNKGKAFIYGGGFDATLRPSVHFSIFGSAHYTYGRFNQDTVLVPLDHVPPITGRIGMRYNGDIWYTELYSLYNSRKKIADYNLAGEDNLPYATPNGTPAWYTINFRAAVTVAKYVQLQAGVENILDKNYRAFASGMSAPGRNFVVAVRFKY
ncbi:MAG: TonB-dependent receptor [Chitinophagaceae bacterium]|nr:TonB-dependent receptor [Chitinophagaceae bacterium]